MWEYIRGRWPHLKNGENERERIKPRLVVNLMMMTPTCRCVTHPSMYMVILTQAPPLSTIFVSCVPCPSTYHLSGLIRVSLTNAYVFLYSVSAFERCIWSEILWLYTRIHTFQGKQFMDYVGPTWTVMNLIGNNTVSLTLSSIRFGVVNMYILCVSS